MYQCIDSALNALALVIVIEHFKNVACAFVATGFEAVIHRIGKISIVHWLPDLLHQFPEKGVNAVAVNKISLILRRRDRGAVVQGHLYRSTRLSLRICFAYLLDHGGKLLKGEWFMFLFKNTQQLSLSLNDDVLRESREKAVAVR